MKDNRKIAQILILIFILIPIMNVFAVYSGYLQYELLERIKNDEFVSDEEAEANDLREGIIALVQFILYILSIILFIIWFRGAYANLSKLGHRTKYSTNMAVWGFFIPIINLYQPYQIMNEIWFESQKLLKNILSDIKINTSTYIIVIWWTLFILTNYVSNFALKSAFKEDTIQEIINSTLAYIASDILDIPAAIFTILLIRQVSNIEIQLYEANKLTGNSIL